MTAVVVGPSGEEIFTEQYGRVKVKFMWDPASDSTDNSCWARVATSRTGQNFGNIFIPRIGDEVVVAFSHGDIDAPMVLGSLWNPDQMPPYALPEHKTVSTMKTRSSMKGTKDNFNELRFEDLKGKEQVFIHAERDLDERVKAESREWVGANRHLIVNSSQLESVGGNKNLTVRGDSFSSIKGERHVRVNKKVAEAYDESFSQEFFDNHTSVIGKDQSRQVSGNLKEKIQSGNHSLVLDQGNTYLQNKLGNWVLQCPLGTIAMTGNSISINGTSGISLQVGGSCISITPASISISAPMVLINSGPAVAVPSPPCTPAAPDMPAEPKKPGLPDVADDGTMFDKM